MTDLLISKIPKEIVDVIKLYTREGCWRNGKYITINKIKKDDYRYLILSKIQIPKPVMFTMLYDCTLPEHFEYQIIFTNNNFSLSVWNLYNPPDKTQYLFYNRKNMKCYVWNRL